MPTDSLPCERLFSITFDTGDRAPFLVPNGPLGTRVVVTAMRGSFEGPRLRGSVADAAGGDWVTVRANGTINVDVRVALVTDDGASILMTYTGLARRDGEVTHVRTAPTFETGDERYEWLNDVFAVGIGTSVGSSVTYDVYALD